jgi:hypothetical protein
LEKLAPYEKSRRPMKKSALYKSLFEHCFKGLSLYLEAGIWIRIWIGIRVKSRIQIRIRIRIK